MSQSNPEAPLLLDEERIHRVRDVFEAARFTSAEILKQFGPSDTPIPRGDVPRLLRGCPPQEPFGALTSLFLFGLALEETPLRQILGPGFVDDAAALGLIGQYPGGGLVGTVSVSHACECFLFQEAPWSPSPPPREIQVMSVSGSSRTAAQLAIRRPVESVLEIGTGCGLLALKAAAHARRVTATDCNPRSLNLAAFSARFNGQGNVEFRAGDLFAPVAGEQFDLVLTNPPFVLTPPAEPGQPRMMYRDGGLPADGLSETVVRNLSRHLKPGGFGQALINWACVKGEDWKNRLRRWFKDSGCDVWVLRFETLDAGRYASSWIPKVSEAEFTRFFQTFNEWMAYYDREGIEAVGSGMIVLRRRDGGSNWFAEDQCPPQIGPCGDAIVRGFELRDYLTRPPSDEELLKTPFRLAPEARWTSSLQSTASGWSPLVSRLQLISGLAFAMDVDAAGMNLVGRCRGDRPLRVALTEVAAETKQDVGWLTGGALPLVRGLIEFGMLLPPGIE